MNTTEQNRDQRIRDIYKNVQTPDSVKERINETLNAIKQQEGSAAAPQIRKKHKKPLSFRKITAIAAAAALGVGGTVFAAERIYQMHLNQNGKYQSDIGISTEQALPEEVEAVEVKAGYIPEGFALDPDKDYYVNESKDSGYYVHEPALIDEADPLSLLYVTDAETMTIDGHEAVYLSISESTDKDWRGDKLFVLYEEMDRVLPMGIWGHADKDELIKMAENIELTPHRQEDRCQRTAPLERDRKQPGRQKGCGGTGRQHLFQRGKRGTDGKCTPGRRQVPGRKHTQRWGINGNPVGSFR